MRRTNENKFYTGGHSTNNSRICAILPGDSHGSMFTESASLVGQYIGCFSVSWLAYDMVLLQVICSRLLRLLQSRAVYEEMGP